jgi:hypothetical protein
MWQGQPPSPAEERDRGIRKVRDWTAGLVAIAAALVAVFAGLAAYGFAGHNAIASADPSNASSTLPQDDQAPSFDRPQSPPGGFFNPGGGGGGRAVSGGS